MYLWVTPSGGKLWRWGYRFESKEKLMSFGKYPDVSLAQARDRHKEARKLLASKIDPMAQRKADKTFERTASENSFANVAALWWKHWSVGKNSRHVLQVTRRMNADILPRLGTRPIAEIKAPEVVEMVKAIQTRGARDIAKRALETVGQIFGYGNRSRVRRVQPLPNNLRRASYFKLYPKPTTPESMLKSCQRFSSELRFIKLPL
ncbi:tyrosine-type recombinase/integrase [Tunturiibacter gelidiferens]|uniref:tyrosine-type recombinase/integrase n=1 Tax=Tunturiibacter gelidiferens TaxID=3069689 RepID=UPI003D9BA664